MDVQPRWDNPERSPERRTNPPYLPERNQFAFLPMCKHLAGDPMRPVAGIRNRHGTRAKETTIRKLTLGLVGAAAVAAGLLLMRQQKQTQPKNSQPKPKPLQGRSRWNGSGS